MFRKIDVHVHTTSCAGASYGSIPFSDYRELANHLESMGTVHAIIMSLGEKGDGISSRAVLEKICRDDSRFSWMGQPVDLDDAPREIDSLREAGAVGLGELAYKEPINSERLLKLYRAAGSAGLPVLMHMSLRGSQAYGLEDTIGLVGLEHALAACPETVFIGHSQLFWNEISSDVSTITQMRGGYETGPIEHSGRVVELMDLYPNLYADLSAKSGSNAMLRDPDFGRWFLDHFQNRLLFGTDTANTGQRFPLAPWIEAECAAGRIGETCCRKIFFENAVRLFSLAV